MKKKFSFICCINKKNALGKGNALLYHIKEDMHLFKVVTYGNVVIMGENTFNSLPGQKPLKGRINIILTNNANFAIPFNEEQEVYITHSWEDVKDICNTLHSDKEWFIVGGASLYNFALTNDMVDSAYITEVDDDADGDAYLTAFNKDDWSVDFSFKSDAEDSMPFTFTKYVKR